jgi:hypothetical protein
MLRWVSSCAFFAMAGFAADLKLITSETLPAVSLILFGAIARRFSQLFRHGCLD